MSTVRYDFPAQAGQTPALLYACESEYDQTWHSTPHTHPHAELFYCVSGQGRFTVGGEEFPVFTDDLILINPYVTHSERSLPGTALHYIVLGVQGLEFLSPDGKNVCFRCFNFSHSRNEFLPYFAEIRREASFQQQEYLTACGYMLRILMIKMNRHAAFDLTCTQPNPTSLSCLDIKRFIDESFAKPLSLDQLAARSHISKYHLVHAFRRAFGISPMAYLAERRLRESRHLLEHTDYPLSEVSQLSGFSSPSYFSQCFTRHTGQTPMQYRRQFNQPRQP